MRDAADGRRHRIHVTARGSRYKNRTAIRPREADKTLETAMTLTRSPAYRLGAMALAAAAMLAVSSVRAEDAYPSKPITIIVGYTTGGANDLLARVVAEKMSTLLKQPVIVENKPGAGSIIGANFVAKAKPDGYTLLMGASGPISFNPSLYKKLPYDPQKDLTPVSLVGTFPLILLTQKSNPDTGSLPNLIAYAKGHPANSNYSASSASFQLISELFKRQTQTKFEYIPYKGSYESVMAVSTGDATMTLVDSGPAMQGVAGGRVRALAVTSPQRTSFLADTPTLKELGIDMNVELWSGLFVPAGTPPAVVGKLEQTVKTIMDDADVRKRVESMSITPASSTSKDFAARIAEEIPFWQKIAQAAGIQPN
jgi:tripartite-type tricarboxylate transporter receptor subunit TctC